MKILVRDEGQSALGAIQLKIKDISSELEKVTVRILRLRSLEKKVLKIDDVTPRKPSTLRRPQTPEPIAATDTPAPAPSKPAKTADTKTVDVTLSLPSFSLSPLYKKINKRVSRTSRKSRIRTLTLCIIVIVALVFFLPWSLHGHTANTSKGQATQPLTRGTPTYPTVLPTGKTVAQLGGWTRISPVNRDPVYAYIDKIGTVQINVSEQPLPTNFTTDTATQVAQLAEGFGATDKFTAGSTVVYIGTSAKGPQSVILTKQNLLILIKSVSVLTNNQWAAYINSLQ